MSPRARSMQNLSTPVRWSIYVALAVAFGIACVYLAFWQFDRNSQRSAELALVEANYDADPVPVAELLPPGAELDPGDVWRPVVLEGQYEPEREVLVRNRAHGGSAAYEVLTPLRLEDGRVFIVDRGWVPPLTGEEASEVAPPPAGDVTVIARLREGEATPASGRGAPPGQVPTINLPLIAEQTGEETILAGYGLVASQTPAPAETPLTIEPPSEDPGPHLSYAVQWVIFGVMGFVFIFYVIRTERALAREQRDTRAADPNDPSEGLDEDDDGLLRRAPRRTPGRKAPRRDKDAADEDAILDAVR